MMKLNIQMFASTNKTANYELPQFVGTDKPSWLGDFNSAMSTIDSGMHENATAIEDLDGDVETASQTASQASQDVASLTSTVNTLSTNVSSAMSTANNAQSTATSALNTANTANGKADTNASAISGLDTRVTQTESDIANFNLTSFETISSNDITLTGGGDIESCVLNVAKNSDGSLAKIYGEITMSSAGSSGTLTFPTSLRPEEQLQINGGCLRSIYSGTSILAFGSVTITIATNGDVTVNKTYVSSNSNKARFVFINSLLFIKQFGDTPIPEGD